MHSDAVLYNATNPEVIKSRLRFAPKFETVDDVKKMYDANRASEN